jgi:uncharacterized protein YndB with AHSA1/START domain
LFTPGDHYGPPENGSIYTAFVGHHRFVVQVRAPREQVFDLWTDLDRAHEWIEGLTRLTDVTGPVTTVGTRYTAWFGRMRSPSEILQVDRPRLVTTRFGSWLLRGVEQATFEDQGDGTHLTQEFWTKGIISAVMARIFAFGSYKGSFRGNSSPSLGWRNAKHVLIPKEGAWTTHGSARSPSRPSRGSSAHLLPRSRVSI